jgi:hypothetical protein
MPDITMCRGERCECKLTCYRYAAEPSMRQRYFVESPIINNGCDYYWKLTK